VIYLASSALDSNQAIQHTGMAYGGFLSGLELHKRFRTRGYFRMIPWFIDGFCCSNSRGVR
jgi:hypothetical protein